MPWMNITCGKCGHTADLDQWSQTVITGELPLNTYQCPACGYAFERRTQKEQVWASGWVEPAQVKEVPIGALL